MKAQAREERQHELTDPERLQREILAREAAEKRLKGYEDKLTDLQSMLQRTYAQLKYAQDTIFRMEQQLRELKASKEMLDARECELNEMARRLVEEREMESEEREKLDKEIRRRDDVRVNCVQVAEKDTETRRLQFEVDEARRQQEAASVALVRASCDAIQHNHIRSIFEPQGREHSEGNNNQMSNSCICIDLTSNEFANVSQWENDRTTALERNTNTKAHLDELMSALDQLRDDMKVTEYDAFLHLENKRTSRDKYKMLRQILTGYTQRPKRST